MNDMEQQQPAETPQANGDGKEQPKARSGYARLRNRHRDLIAAHEDLQKDYCSLLDQQAALQRDVDNLLAQHQRLMQSAKAPTPPAANWFEGAKKTLSQLAAEPDEKSIDIMTSSLATLLQRLAQIRLRASQ